MDDEPKERVDIPEWIRVPIRRLGPPPLRPGMTIEEVVAEGHSVGINPSKGVIVVDGKEMPIAEEMQWTNETYKPE